MNSFHNGKDSSVLHSHVCIIKVDLTTFNISTCVSFVFQVKKAMTRSPIEKR